MLSEIEGGQTLMTNNIDPRTKTLTSDEETVEIIEVIEDCDDYSDLDDEPATYEYDFDEIF